jgi:hypothetical protein
MQIEASKDTILAFSIFFLNINSSNLYRNLIKYRKRLRKILNFIVKISI